MDPDQAYSGMEPSRALGRWKDRSLWSRHRRLFVKVKSWDWELGQGRVGAIIIGVLDHRQGGRMGFWDKPNRPRRGGSFGVTMYERGDE